MKTFAEFESIFLGALQQERSDVQGLQGLSEAQLSAWIEHLFRDHLGYIHWKEITKEGTTPIGSKGSKQLFPDLRIDILDNGVVFVECKRFGRLEGPRGQEELHEAVAQLRSYIRAHVDQAAVKPKTVLGVVTDGNRWLLMGLNRANEFHVIAEWNFLTDDPRLIAQRLWLLAKPALAQPTSALVEFLARRTLAEVLKDSTRSLTRKVNEKLPDGSVSEELIGKWIREAFSDQSAPSRMVAEATTSLPALVPAARPEPAAEQSDAAEPGSDVPGKRILLSDLLGAGLLQAQDVLTVDGADGRRQTATITADGKIIVAGHVYDSVSPAAQAALELAGKSRKAVNGWAAFRVLRGGNQLGTLLEIRSQYEDKEEEASVGTADSDGVAPAASEPSGAGAATLAVDQLKPLLGLLPELVVNVSKSAVSLYAGKAVVAYAFPRKRGAPRLRVYVGEACPDWVTPDSGCVAWGFIDDWAGNVERVVALLKEAPRHRAADMMAGRDPYRRRPQPSAREVVPGAAEV